MKFPVGYFFGIVGLHNSKEITNWEFKRPFLFFSFRDARQPRENNLYLFCNEN